MVSTAIRHYRLVLSCFACVLCLLPTGCSSDFPKESFSQIEEGMTVDEVQAILGPGREVPWAEVESIIESFPTVELTEASCDKWIMWGNRKSYGLVGFKDGEVCQRLSR